MLIAPRLKICGVTRAETVPMLAAAGADALGLNFWPGSRRFVGPEVVRGWDLAWPRGLRRVGLFVNPTLVELEAVISFGFIDSLQLHGNETPELVAAAAGLGLPVVKAIGLGEGTTLPDPAPWVEAGAEGILLDAHAPGVWGGTGRRVDWDRAAVFVERSPLPVWLAGGLTPENVAEAVARIRPAWVDVASGAESAPGNQDPSKVAALVEGVARATKS